MDVSLGALVRFDRSRYNGRTQKKDEKYRVLFTFGTEMIYSTVLPISHVLQDRVL